MPSNEELSSRAQQLVADIQSLTQSAKQHCDDYKALSNEAYTHMQAYLKSKGVTTLDQWLNTCQKQLSPEDAAKVKKILADLEPAHGLEALVQPTEIAKFIAGWIIVEGGWPLLQTGVLCVKSWYNNFLVINRLPVANAGAVAGEIEMSSIASTTEELAEATEFIESNEVPALVASAEAEVGEIAATEAAIAAEATTMAAAEAASSWNFILLGIGAVIMAGTYAYNKINEDQDADKLRETIAQLGTARLYALVGEKSILAQTDEHSLLGLLNQALKEGDVGAQNFFEKNATNVITKNVAAIDVQECYGELGQKDASRNSMTDADPSYQAMLDRHKGEVDKIRENAKK